MAKNGNEDKISYSRNKKFWDKFFTNPKDWQISFKFLMIYLIVLGLGFFIPGLIEINIIIPVNVSELGTSGAGQFFVWRLDKIIEIILMGPLFAVVFYFLIKKITKKIDLKQGKNKYWIRILEFGIVLSIGILVAGHFIHLMFDYTNYLYRQVGGYDTTELFLFIYWSDEWLGHHLIHYMYFTQLVLALGTEFLIDNHRKMRWDEIAISIVLGFGIFVVFGFSTYEGQAANHLMILSLILLIIEILVILFKKINPIKYPILLSTVISNVIVISFYFFWIFSYRFKPYYPFIYQPSELSGEFDLMNNILWIILGVIIIYGTFFAIKLISKYKARKNKNNVE
ncbi:MAG: hypothetical protein GF329_07515 [Candidatus Lokiarchaeota archaeon]|nr:hypothetical protein [Candidatus Lokiarchaeota archaeon]